MSSNGAPAPLHADTRPVPRSRRPYTAFVFSGGSSLAALQVGMLRALYERGISADVLVGTSMGSLNTAFVASRPQTPATAGELARVWCSIQREDVFPVSVRTLVRKPGEQITFTVKRGSGTQPSQSTPTG
jgi:predicted acylesterase/phospholipase RssA